MIYCVGCGVEIVYTGDLFPSDPGRTWRGRGDNDGSFRCRRVNDEINVRFHYPPLTPDRNDFEAISQWLDQASERPRPRR